MRNKIALVTAVLILCGMFSSCASKTTVVSPDVEIPPVSTDAVTTSASVTTVHGNEMIETNSSTVETSEGGEAVYSIELYNGWWHHVGGSVAETPVVEVIKIDAESSTWTEYSKSGIVGGTYSCYVDEMGIHLDYGDVGTTVLIFDGVSLLNAMGYIEYVPGDPIEAVSPSAYEGKWYELGDKDGRCIEIRGNTYNLDSVSGTWTSETVTTASDGVVVEEIRLKLLDRSGVELVVADTGDTLFDPEGNTAYFHESVLDISKGEDLIKKYDLICHTWKGESEDKADIEFGYYGNKFFLVNRFELNGETQIMREVGGTWSINGYELSLHYSDGHEEITPYDSEQLMLSYYKNMVVTKEK